MFRNIILRNIVYIKPFVKQIKYNNKQIGISFIHSTNTTHSKDKHHYKKEFVLAKNRPNHDKLNLWNKTKLLTKQYAPIFFCTYWLTWSGVTYGMYKGLDYGWITYEDWKWLQLDKLHELYEHYGIKLGCDMDKYQVNNKTDKILVAFLLGKITKPIQFMFTGIVTPHIAKYLGYAPKKIKK